MSKLRRSLARRDKALELLQLVEGPDEEKRPVTLSNCKKKFCPIFLSAKSIYQMTHCHMSGKQ